MQCVAEWAKDHDAEFHIGRTKTVAMRSVPLDPPQSQMTDEGVRMRDHQTGELKTLTEVTRHVWLGVLWPAGLLFLEDVHRSLAIAAGQFATLCGLVDSGVIPCP